jgi:hypothetical protein
MDELRAFDRIKGKLLEYAKDEKWTPDETDIETIVDLSKKGVENIADLALLMNKSVRQFAFAAAQSDAIVSAIRRGKLELLIELNTSLQGMVRNNTDKISGASLAGALFLLRTRFSYADNPVLNRLNAKMYRSNIKYNSRKLDIEKEKLEYLKDATAQRLSLRASETKLHEWKNDSIES